MTTINTQFDLVINNGRVMDPETGLDAIRNVGVRDGKISIITDKAIQGVDVIDATSRASITASASTLQKSAILSFIA